LKYYNICVTTCIVHHKNRYFCRATSCTSKQSDLWTTTQFHHGIDSLTVWHTVRRSHRHRTWPSREFLGGCLSVNYLQLCTPQRRVMLVVIGLIPETLLANVYTLTACYSSIYSKAVHTFRHYWAEFSLSKKLECQLLISMFGVHSWINQFATAMYAVAS